MVERNTAEITSAQAVTARSARAAGSQVVSPNTAIASPHTITAIVTAWPCRRIRPTHPGGQRADEGACAGCGVEQAGGGGASAEDSGGRRWETGLGACQNGRAEVGHERLLDGLASQGRASGDDRVGAVKVSGPRWLSWYRSAGAATRRRRGSPAAQPRSTDGRSRN